MRYPRGLKKIAEQYETPVAKLAREVVASVTGVDAVQWSMAVAPLGAGSWGVVWPLADERFILKLTADPTEGPIIQTIMDEHVLLNHMGIIHYFAVKKIPATFTWKNKPQTVYVVIAERLQHSSQVPTPTYDSRELRDYNNFVHALYKLKDTAGKLVHELGLKRPSAYKVDQLHEAWTASVRRLQQGPMEDFIWQFFDVTRDDKAPESFGQATGGILADIHFNNVGKRVVDWTDLDIELEPSDYWVISDPGHSSLVDKRTIEDLRPNPRLKPDRWAR